jgi:hypothetical protein
MTSTILSDAAQHAQYAHAAANSGDLSAASHWSELAARRLTEVIERIPKEAVVGRGLACAETADPQIKAVIHGLVEAVVLAYADRDLAKAKYEEHCEKTRYDELSSAAIDSIRQMLNRNFVPPASFVDDHVAHAVVQRNKLIENMRAMKEDPALKSPALDAAIDKAFEDGRIDPRVLNDATEEVTEEDS